MMRLFRPAVILSLLLLSACATSVPQLTRNVPAGIAGLPLPSPAQLARQASFVDFEREQYGAQFSAVIPARNTEVEGAAAAYYPYWQPGDDIGDTAYACHIFMLDGYSGPPQLTLSWDSAPAAADDLWLGLANYTRNRWDWRQTADGASLDFGGIADYFAPGSGQFAVVVLLLGDTDCTLQRLRVGGALEPQFAPQAVLSADVLYGQAPLSVNFDCSSSFDSDGAVMLCEADDDGDLVWDHSQPGCSLAWSAQFDTGVHTVTLRVTDDDGLTDTATVTLNVADSLSWPGNVIPPGDKEVLALWDVGGLPAVAWRGGDTNIYFQRAQDALGSAWDAPVIALSYSGGTWPVAVAQVNGHPALVYENLSYGNEWFMLYYMVAKDELGTAWNEPVYVTRTPGYPNLAGYPELTEVQGRPALLYQCAEAGWRQLLYYRANDALGFSWGAGVQVGDDDVIGSSGIALIDGYPAVLVTNKAEATGVTTLNYARALDAAGAAWGAAVQLLDLGATDVCYGAELAQAGAGPAALYITGAPGAGDTELIYHLAADPLGADWSTPGVVVYTTLDFVTKPALAVTAGHPTWAAVEWSPLASGRVLVSRALDPAGAAWEAPAQVRYTATGVEDYPPFARPQLGLSGGMLGCVTSSYCAESMLSVLH